MIGSHARTLPLLAVMLALPTCGEDRDRPAAAASGPGGGAPWSERLEDPSAATVLAALAQGHADARGRLGPHRLSYSARFSLAPDAEAGEPRVGRTAPATQTVNDELTLAWAAAAGEPPRFSLTQHNDHERGREVIVVDDRIYTRLRHRSWHERPLESQIHEQWLDDAQHAAHDAFALAAKVTALEAEAVESSTFGRPAVKLVLARAQGIDRDLEPPSGWRRRAEIDEVAGEVVIERETGLWLSATVEVRYRLQNDAGVTLHGQMLFEGSVTPLDPSADPISAPADARPTPRRVRPEVERRKLLDGLAGQ